MEALTHPFATPLWIALIALLLAFVSYLLFHPHPFQRKTTGRCPPQIWTYLPTTSPTPQQARCIASWHTHLPSTWTIHVMTPQTVYGYLHRLPKPHEAPIFRDPDRWLELVTLTALEEHGGVWLDPNTLIRAPLTDFLPDPKELSAFQHTLPLSPSQNMPPSALPLLDKRAIACPPAHPLIRQWRSEYLRLLSFPSVEAYLQSLPAPLLVSSFSFPVNWVMSLALQHVLLVNPYPMESLHLLPIDTPRRGDGAEGGGGPLHHLQEARGDPKKAEAIATASQEPIVFLGAPEGL